MACDICGKNDETLEDLREIYATKEIRQVCSGCQKIIDKQLSKVRAVTHNILRELVRRFVRNMKQEAQPHDN